MNIKWSEMASTVKLLAMAASMGGLIVACGGGGGSSAGGAGGTPAPIAAVADTTAQVLTQNTAMTSFRPLVASGGTTPYTYSYTGNLPHGLTFDKNTGAVTGTPDTVQAASTLIFSVMDFMSVVAPTTSSVSFTVNATGVIALTATATTTEQILVDGTQMKPFTPLVASGGTQPYTYFSDPLPTGLSLNASTGEVTGIPQGVFVKKDLKFSVKDKTNAIAPTISTVFFTVNSAGGPPNPTPDYPAVTLNYYTDAATSLPTVGGLWQVKSDMVSAPTLLNSNALIGRGAAGGGRIATVKAKNQLSSDPYNYAIIFATTDGKLYKQYANSGTTIQISNISGIASGTGGYIVAGTTVNDLCRINALTDFANPENSVIILTLAGPTKLCEVATSVNVWIRLSADANTVPAKLPGKILQPLMDQNTGAITGFVGMTAFELDSSTLVKYDTNLANPEVIYDLSSVNTNKTASTFVAQNVSSYGSMSANTVLLGMVNSTNFTADYRMVDVSANTVSASLYHLTNNSAPKYSVYDDSGYYFVDLASTSVIRKIAVGGSTAATEFATLITGAVGGLQLSSNSVIYSSGNAIFSTGKNPGATPVLLASGSKATSTTEYVSLYSSGVKNAGYVFYNRYVIRNSDLIRDESQTRAEVVKEDGSGIQVYGTSGAFAKWGPAFISNGTLGAITLLEAAPGVLSLNGASIKIVNANTGSKSNITQSTLIPNDLQSFVGDIYGTRGLLRANFYSSNQVFSLDALASNSFATITRTTSDKVLVE